MQFRAAPCLRLAPHCQLGSAGVPGCAGSAVTPCGFQHEAAFCPQHLPRPCDPCRPLTLAARCPQDFASHFTYPHMTVAGDDLLVVMRATAPVANMTATSKWWGLLCRTLLCPPFGCWLSCVTRCPLPASQPLSEGGAQGFADNLENQSPNTRCSASRCVLSHQCMHAKAASAAVSSAPALAPCDWNGGSSCAGGVATSCTSETAKVAAAGTTTTTATRCRSTGCAASGGTPTCSGPRTRGSTRCGRG